MKIAENDFDGKVEVDNCRIKNKSEFHILN